MGIKHFEIDDYEADDIVGTICRWADEDDNWDALLVTSDHDYLQLISNEVSIKLLEPKGYIKYNPENFKEHYGIEPEKVTDLKGLMGDSSDNIPGVPGVGEKTALKLIGQFGVGFYSAFMVAKDIKVISKKYGSKDAYMWESSGVDGYTVTKANKDSYGTDVILTLKDDTDDATYSDYLHEYELNN